MVSRLLSLAALCIALVGAVLNEWTVTRFFSADGDLSAATRSQLWALQALAFLAAGYVYAMRRHPGLLAIHVLIAGIGVTVVIEAGVRW